MKILKPLSALVVLALVLSGCNLLMSPPQDPGLVVGTVYMHGVLEEQVQVNANGYWELHSSTTWLQVNPKSGFGDATVNLTVDPSGLAPAEHVAALTLSEFGETNRTSWIVFEFPTLRGSVTMGPLASNSSELLSVQPLTDGPGQLLVGIRSPESEGFSSASASGFKAMAAGLVETVPGAALQRTLPRARVAVVEANSMRQTAALLSRNPDVRYVEPNRPMWLLSNDTLNSQQWALATIRAEEAWPTGDGTGVRAAVIDAGFHPDHPDLIDNVVSTWDFISDSSEIINRPLCGAHGDHVAGILAATTNNIEGIAGTAPGAQLLLLNAGMEDDGGCPLDVAAVAEAVWWLIDNNGSGVQADIVNMSFGGAYTQTLEVAVEAAYSAGITMVAASGNSSTGSVLYPAAYPQVLAVSATNINDEVAAYSTTGPEVFLSAPGGDGSDGGVISTYYDETALEPYTYAYMSGTSMASPAVAAVAALAKSVNPNLTPVGIAGLLADTSIDRGDTGRDESFGYGRIDAHSAVTRAEAQAAAGEPTGYRVRVEGSEFQVPAVEDFTGGYVGGTIFVEAGSDYDWDGILDEPDEYYGAWSGEVQFTGPYFEVLIPVEKQ